MKIVIPADIMSTDSSVCQSFGRTPYYAVYNTETCNTEFIENSAASSAGGAGIKAAQMIVDIGASIIITFRCGENAANVLLPAGIKIFTAQNNTVAMNIKLFIENKLLPLSDIHAGFHNHGGNL